jgi:hypothetical protein
MWSGPTRLLRAEGGVDLRKLRLVLYVLRFRAMDYLPALETVGHVLPRDISPPYALCPGGFLYVSFTFFITLHVLP